MFLRPREQAWKLALIRNSYCPPTRPRTGKPHWFLTLLVWVGVSEAGRWKPDLTQDVGGKGLGETGTRGGIINSKPRHHDHEKEAGGEVPSSESSCVCTSYLSEMEGHRSADAFIPVHWMAGETNMAFVVRLLYGQIYCNWLLPGLRSVLGRGSRRGSIVVLFTWVFTSCFLMSCSNNSPSLSSSLLRPVLSDNILPSSH